MLMNFIIYELSFIRVCYKMAYTAVFSNKSQMDAENEVKANVKRKCFEQKIAEDDLCPFVSKN